LNSLKKKRYRVIALCSKTKAGFHVPTLALLQQRAVNDSLYGELPYPFILSGLLYLLNTFMIIMMAKTKTKAKVEMKRMKRAIRVMRVERMMRMRVEVEITPQ